MSTTTQNSVQEGAALQTYTVDTAHSQVGFVVRHMGFSKVHGHFEDFEGAIRVDPQEIDTLEAEISIDAASITTRDEARDEHLRSEDFFQVEDHPKLTFKSTGVTDVSGDSFKLAGELTIRGKSKSVELDSQYLGEGVDPFGATRVGFEGRTTINRKEFGLTWNQALEAGGVLVSEKVEIVLDIEATQDEG